MSDVTQEMIEAGRDAFEAEGEVFPITYQELSRIYLAMREKDPSWEEAVEVLRQFESLRPAIREILDAAKASRLPNIIWQDVENVLIACNAARAFVEKHRKDER